LTLKLPSFYAFWNAETIRQQYQVIKVNKEIKKVKSYRFGGSIIVSLW